MRYIFKCENCDNRMIIETLNMKRIRGQMSLTCDECLKIKEAKIE